jgi:hypothetical protein
MKVVISVCSNKTFSYSLMPLAYLNLRPPMAVNDNNVLFSPPRTCHPLHGKRAAWGRAEFIFAVLAIVTGLITLPLLQGLAVPMTTASEERPQFFAAVQERPIFSSRTISQAHEKAPLGLV